MFLKTFLTTLCFSLSTIYQWMDGTGTTHFSDQPAKNAIHVPLPSLQTYHSQASYIHRAAAPASPQKAYLPNNIITITTPHNAETIRNNQGTITININTSPHLSNSQRIQLFLDGQIISQSQTPSKYQLKNIDRGKHCLEARLINEQGVTIAQSERIVFYVQRPIVKKKAMPTLV